MFLFALRDYKLCLVQCFYAQQACLLSAFMFENLMWTFTSFLLKSQSGEEQEAEGNGGHTKGQRPYNYKYFNTCNYTD